MSIQQKISRILMITGVALILASSGLFIYNKVYDYRAGLRAQALLDEMMAEVDWVLPPVAEMEYTAPPSPDNEVNEVIDVTPPLDVDTDIESIDEDTSNEVEPPTVVVEVTPQRPPPTYSTLGVLSIPKLSVRLPIIAECTDELLKISCCRISGLADEKPNRLVLAGHNIKSHFKGLDTLTIGDQIAFTSKSGVTYYYAATEFVDLHKTEGAEVLAVDGWDITLITCKTDNTYRTVVRFAEITKTDET